MVNRTRFTIRARGRPRNSRVRPFGTLPATSTLHAFQARDVITISPNAAPPPTTTARNDSPLLPFAANAMRITVGDPGVSSATAARGPDPPVAAHPAIRRHDDVRRGTARQSRPPERRG